MNRLWTILGVRNVPAAHAWYQSLLGIAASEPAHNYFAQVTDADGTVLVALHAWGSHDHPTLLSADAPPGNGLLLFFRVDDYDGALDRARSLVEALEEDPHRNPNTGTMEFSLRDLDGYFVTISASDSSRV